MATERPLVSIITPFLNAQEFIQETIDSVVAQTYDNWELLLIDDGSTDGSTTIARAAAQQHPDRIRYLEHPGHANRGKSASRNTGLASARGDLITFLDADDIFFPLKLERQVPLLLAHPEAGMLHGASLFWYFSHDSPPAELDFVQAFGFPLNTLYRPPHMLIALLDNEDIHPTNCSMLVRRELCEEIGGYDERVEYMYGDTVFLAKLYLTTSVYVADECSSVYRLHGMSTCHRAVDEGMYHPTEPNPARGAFLFWLREHLQSRGIRDGRLWRSLNRELRPYTHPLRSRVSGLVGDASARGLARLRRLAGRGLAHFRSNPSFDGETRSNAADTTLMDALHELERFYVATRRDDRAERIRTLHIDSRTCLDERSSEPDRSVSSAERGGSPAHASTRATRNPK